MPEATLKLSLTITYELYDVEVEVLKNKLRDLVYHGYDEGLLTGDIDAEVTDHRATIETAFASPRIET